MLFGEKLSEINPNFIHSTPFTETKTKKEKEKKFIIDILHFDIELGKKVDGLPLNEFRVLGEKCSARWKFRILEFRIFHQYIFTNFIISSIFWYKYVHNFLHSSISVIQIKENNYRSIISVLLINSKGGR